MQTICPTYNGTGVIRPPMAQAVVCPTCGGTGFLVDGQPTTALPVQPAAIAESPSPNRRPADVTGTLAEGYERAFGGAKRG